MVRVTHGDEQATVYPEGGIGFARRIPGLPGWFVDDEPSRLIYTLAVAARAAAYPLLPPLPGQPRLRRKHTVRA